MLHRQKMSVYHNFQSCKKKKRHQISSVAVNFLPRFIHQKFPVDSKCKAFPFEQHNRICIVSRAERNSNFPPRRTVGGDSCDATRFAEEGGRLGYATCTQEQLVGVMAQGRENPPKYDASAHIKRCRKIERARNKPTYLPACMTAGLRNSLHYNSKQTPAHTIVTIRIRTIASLFNGTKPADES